MWNLKNRKKSQATSYKPQVTSFGYIKEPIRVLLLNKKGKSFFFHIS